MTTNADGSVTFHLFKRNERTRQPEPVDVDVPPKVYSGASAVIPQTQREDGSISPEDPRFALLEVAYAKAFGANSAKAIEGGMSAEVLFHLTGKSASTVAFKPPGDIALTSEKQALKYYKELFPGITAKDVHDMLVSSMRDAQDLLRDTEVLAKKPVGATANARIAANAEAAWRLFKDAETRGVVSIAGTNLTPHPEADGLQPTHAYAVMGTYESGGKRMIHLRDPQGPAVFIPLEKLVKHLGQVTVAEGLSQAARAGLTKAPLRDL